MKLGLVPAHRGFFSGALAVEMRDKTIATLAAAGAEVVVPDPSQTRLGCVESREEAALAGRLFRAAEVDGIVVGAMNFGDEQAAAAALRTADLPAPVLLFGCPENGPLRPGAQRRDAFCGLLSIAAALRQVGVEYSLPRQPILDPASAEFAAEAAQFLGVCRTVQSLRRARYGQIGARPDAFWTCRFDEAALQRLGPTTVTLDLSELLLAVREEGIREEAGALAASMDRSADLSQVAAESRSRLAALEAALRRFVREQQLDAVAIQCWTSLQRNLGVCSCFAMSRLADDGIPAACEADVLGALSMHALQLAGTRPAALADWNNLHHADQDLVNLWHCGVFPASWAKRRPIVGPHEILSGPAAILPADQTQGVINLELADGPVTLCRVAHDAENGWQVVLAEGVIEERPESTTFGSYGWCRIPRLRELYRDVLLRHFPHHVAAAPGRHAGVLSEAFGRYLGFKVHRHG
jgi:L-fucose isomerase-like protein